MFQDRSEAGRRLAGRLFRFKGRRPVVLALPRGGVPVGFEIASALEAPLDLVLVRKIGAPSQPELAVAAVVGGPEPQTVVNEDVMRTLGLSEAYIEEQSRHQLAEIERRRRLYLGGRARADVKGRTAIIVDDGIATGATIRAALKATRRAAPERLVLAVPVAPPDTIRALRAEADEIECLSTPGVFGAISVFYADFHQVGDDEVIDLLARAAGPGASGKAALR
ncbi:MAG: phosphoribosyltransferase [Kiloniellaceae bacterium]